MITPAWHFVQKLNTYKGSNLTCPTSMLCLQSRLHSLCLELFERLVMTRPNAREEQRLSAAYAPLPFPQPPIRCAHGLERCGITPRNAVYSIHRSGRLKAVPVQIPFFTLRNIQVGERMADKQGTPKRRGQLIDGV